VTSPCPTQPLSRQSDLVGADETDDHGLRQTIGDTLGIGGIFRALRTFPVLQGITEDMAAVCPDAWLLNYTNPMTMNVQWHSRVAPSVKSVGLCHSVYWTVAGLCDVVGVPLEGTDISAAGVNHQAWLLRWERDGEELYPRLAAKVAADPQLRRRRGAAPASRRSASGAVRGTQQHLPRGLRADRERGARGRSPTRRQAAMLDPNTAATLAVDDIWALCDAMTLAHGELLPAALRAPVRL
jgi:alpha-galactosidase/6-phospho-beta-glucosidase family protein